MIETLHLARMPSHPPPAQRIVGPRLPERPSRWRAAWRAFLRPEPAKCGPWGVCP